MTYLFLAACLGWAIINVFTGDWLQAIAWVAVFGRTYVTKR